MEALECLLTRRSVPRLVAPAPDDAQLDRLVPTLVTDAAFVARYGEVRQIVGD